MPEIGQLKQVDQGPIHVAPIEMSEIGQLKQVDQGAIHVASVEMAVIEWKGDQYEGTYSVTPSPETQVLVTKDKYMDENVVVEPIPSNYGLIMWDGYGLWVT